MAGHERFNFRTIEQLQEKIDELGVNIKLEEDTSILGKEVKIGGKTAPNSIAVLPMEGCDSNPDGSPSDLVKRRYKRFASGGAGLLWWEANAVVKEGKANELQMMLTDDNIGEFEALLKETNQDAVDAAGAKPINVLQLTHSGRYSRPVGHNAAPIIGQRDPILDPRTGVVDDSAIATDEYLESLVERYVHSAVLAEKAGFDGVDVKACHRYLLSELLASHTREGKFGGSYENRTRLIMEIIREIKKATSDDFIISSRFNVFDAHPYPYGFGCDKEDMWKFDPTEPMMLVKDMIKNGVGLLSNSAGNPYYIFPQVTRPFDLSSEGIPIPEEHQLVSIERLFEFSREIQKAAGDVPVIGNGYSWLRQFAANAGAANVKDGSCAMMGLGRSSIAYPDAPLDILKGEGMVSSKTCTSCSKCTQIMRDHGRTGCVIRDHKVYLPLYNEAREDAKRRAEAASK